MQELNVEILFLLTHSLVMGFTKCECLNNKVILNVHSYGMQD